MLSTLAPVTRAKPTAKIASASDGDGWILIENGIRLDDDWFETDYSAETPIEVLKLACQQAKYNAIQI
eukprot:5364545-Prymnesium_polylepis.1